jgi:hypothetical protein
MTHPTTPVPPATTLKTAIATGLVSKNAQVSGYPGHPNPTIAALVSDGLLDLNKTVGSLTFVGFGGE